MSFPGAGSAVEYNAGGEPVGWDRHYADAPEPEGDFVAYVPGEDQERDLSEEAYNGAFCAPCGVSPCEAPEGIHADEPEAE